MKKLKHFLKFNLKIIRIFTYLFIHASHKSFFNKAMYVYLHGFNLEIICLATLMSCRIFASLDYCQLEKLKLNKPPEKNLQTNILLNYTIHKSLCCQFLYCDVFQIDFIK